MVQICDMVEAHSCLFVIIIVLVIVLLFRARRDRLLAQPDSATADKYARELIDKRYGMANYSTARKVFPWMDPVAYESARSAIRTGGYDAGKIAEALRS